MVATAPQLLVVNPGVPAEPVQELIHLARGKPGALNFGSGGAGTLSHPAGGPFKAMAGVNLMHIPYKGTILAPNDLLAGQVQVVFSDMPIALPHARSGRVRALAVTSAKRTPLVSDMPTVAEAGVRGYAVDNSWGIFAARRVPKAISDKLNAQIVRVHQVRGVRERYATLGLEATSSTPEQFAEVIRSDAAKFSKIIKATGAKLD